MRQWLSAWICRWIARSNELDSFEMNPRVVRCTIEAAVFDALPKKRDHSLCAVLVFIGQIDLIAEDDDPFA